MSSTLEVRRQERVDRLELVRSKHESLLKERDGGNLSDNDRDQIRVYREETAGLLEEIEQLSNDIDAYNRAAEMSQSLRRAAMGSTDGVDISDDGVVYRDFYTYARDFVLTRDLAWTNAAARKWSISDQQLEAMAERQRMLKRTPANTLSSDVTGLQPEQHINQIFQVINKSRPLVASARRVDLERGAITYPVVTQRPVVAVQASQKTEAGNQKMIIDMETANASTYLGGGDISWQAVNWSTPNALQMWFDLAAEDYAKKTEADAGQALQHSAFTYGIASGKLGASPTYADFMTAVGAGGAEVYENSDRMADTVYLAPDRWWYLFGTTSTASSTFTTVNVDGVGPLRFVASPGLDPGVVVVGAREGLLVAETPGAPVELRVTEPAIGGYEVGLIGAFEAVVVDPGAFAIITTAS